MNKLISRNPILRFKEGKKLIKAQGGLDDTFKLLSDTAERTAEREQYWADEEARKARAAYDRQMKSSKKSERKAGRMQTYKGLPIVIIDGFKGAIENADGSYTWVDVKDFDGQNIQDTMPFESTVKNYPIDLAQIPEVSKIYSSLNPPTQVSRVPVIDINKVSSTKKFYNRADVRNYMRRYGLNPYSYTADYRIALRKVLNGQGTESDYNMVKAMGLKLKKGGLLPSRNSIQRFKNRKFN